MPRRRAATAAAAAALNTGTDSGGGAAAAAARQPEPQPPPWRKVLYERQPYADSHTGEGFLEELVVNASVPRRDYRTVVWSALTVDQQLSTVTTVGSASYHLYQGTIASHQLLLADALLMVMGAVLYLLSSAWVAAKYRAAGAAQAAAAAAAGSPGRLGSPSKLRAGTAGGIADGVAWNPSPSKRRRHRSSADGNSNTGQHPSQLVGWRAAADGVASMAALAAATALLSPLLGTLTQNVSSDSVVACACFLLLAHLYLHDYHFAANLTAHLSGSLALGCAVCGSVLVASRLGSPAAVYAQLLLSLELYILGPYCRRQVAAASPVAHLALTAGMGGGAATLLARQSVLLTSAFCCSLLFVTFICPMWLVRIHKYKAAINGPWDEAVPRLSRQVARHLSQQQ